MLEASRIGSEYHALDHDSSKVSLATSPSVASTLTIAPEYLDRCTRRLDEIIQRRRKSKSRLKEEASFHVETAKRDVHMNYMKQLQAISSLVESKFASTSLPITPKSA